MEQDEEQVTKLTELEVHEVSLVDRGANRRTVCLTKAEEIKMEEKEALATQTEAEQMLTASLPADMPEETRSNLISAFRLLSEMPIEAIEVLLTALIGGEPEEAPEEAPKEAVAEEAAPAEETVKRDQEIEKRDQEIEKRDQEIEKRDLEIKKRDEEIAILKNEIENHAKIQKRAELKSKCEKELSKVPLDPEILVEKILQDESLFEVFKSISNVVEKSELLREIGKSELEVAPRQKLESRIRDLRTSNPAMTREQAYVTALKMDPELMKAIRAEEAQNG